LTIGLAIVGVGEPRIRVSGTPGLKAIDCPEPRAPSICNVAAGAMVIDPVPLTEPWISRSPPVEEPGTLLFDASTVPLLIRLAAIRP
jgi:hypothetical protein